MTKRLYYTDSYMQEFSSPVLGIFPCDEQRICVELEQTCFYPESGGQLSDRGTLGSVRLLDAVDEGDRILHVLEGPPAITDGQVQGAIDWDRRFDHMQQHTGQHIISQAFGLTLGARTESFHMGPSSSTIDLSVDSLTSEQIYAAEDLAGRIIFENRPIRARFIESEDQMKLPLRKPAERTGEIRIVEIEGFDHSACGGTHCLCTGEVGLVKVRKWERVRGRARVEFFCGGRALLDYRRKNRAVYLLSKLYSTSEDEVVGNAQKHLEIEKSQRKDHEKLQDQLLAYQAENLRSSARIVGRLRVISARLEGIGLKELNKLASRILRDAQSTVLLLGAVSGRTFLLFARTRDVPEVNMAALVDEIAILISGSGGGTAERAQATGESSDRLSAAIDLAARKVCRFMRENEEMP